MAAICLGAASHGAAQEPTAPSAPPLAAEELPAPLFLDEEPLDPELSQPLTPLDEFDIVTREPPPGAEQDRGPAEVRYSFTVRGLEATGLEGRFSGLSALRQNRNDTATLGQIVSRTNADAQLLGRILRADGYFDAVVDTAVDPGATPQDPVAVTLTVTPGDQYRVDEIQLTGPETAPPGLAREALTLKSGEPITAVTVEAAEANVRLRLPEQGYPFVEIGQRDILLDETDRTGDYTLPVDPGPRARFGGIRVEGDQVFGADHMEVIARFDRGELYDERLVDDFRRALIGTGLFSTAGVEPIRTDAPAGPDGTVPVDLRVRSEAAPPRTISGGAGYGTGEGLRVEAVWTHRNFFPPEGALSLRAVAGTAEQRLGATFRRSDWGQRDRSLQFLAEGSRERRDNTYDATSFTLGARVSRESTHIWRKRWTYSAGVELIATSESAQERVASATYFIGALPLQVGYDRSNDLLDPTRGFRIVGRVSPETSLRGGAALYVRNLLDASAYLPVGPATVLAGRVRLGSIFGVERSTIAPSRRLYGGGGGSVRGFGYQELGPITPQGERLGGRSLVEFSVEARHRFGNFGIVPFIDVGQAYESTFPRFSDLRYAAGIGARYYTNFGPLRIDVARSLNRRIGDPNFALYISIGQAF